MLIILIQVVLILILPVIFNNDVVFLGLLHFSVWSESGISLNGGRVMSIMSTAVRRQGSQQSKNTAEASQMLCLVLVYQQSGEELNVKNRQNLWKCS